LNKEESHFEKLLLDSYFAAIDAADPHKVIAAHLPVDFTGNVVVVGAGKAAASMAAAVEEAWPDKNLRGVVITRKGCSVPTKKIRVLEASHPIPDASNLEATKAMLDEVEHLEPGDLLLALISGGGSSLLALPVDGVTIDDIRVVTEELLKIGTAPEKIDAVRKHVSRVKGGQLALAARARGADVLALIISDSVGDNPSEIASGPCSEDFSTYADALWYLNQARISVPESILNHLRNGARGLVGETPKIGDVRMRGVKNKIVANSFKGLQAAALFFKEQGLRPVIIGDEIVGEARAVALQVSRKVRLELSKPRRKPVVLLSGGACQTGAEGASVTRSEACAEFLLALADELNGEEIYGISADTDGSNPVDGCAGAFLQPDTMQRARELNLDVKELLAEHRALELFRRLGDLSEIGPTSTNINEYRAILIR
jgi:hydroxypyruvate reductase